MNRLRLALAWAVLGSVIALVFLPAWITIFLVGRVASRIHVLSNHRRRAMTSGFLIRWGDRLFRIVAWGHGGGLVGLPVLEPGRPVVLLANRRCNLDVLVMAHLCRRLGLCDVRWIVRSCDCFSYLLGKLFGEFCLSAAGLDDGDFNMRVYVRASMERESGASFVFFPEAEKYDSASPSHDWASVHPPKVAAFRRLCMGLTCRDVITTALVWRTTGVNCGPFIGIIAERHAGLPQKPGIWLRDEWRRVEATLMPFCD